MAALQKYILAAVLGLTPGPTNEPWYAIRLELNQVIVVNGYDNVGGHPASYKLLAGQDVT